MKIDENGKMLSFQKPSGLRLARVPTLGAMEEALAELRDLEWRAPAGGRALARSPWASDGPWNLAQREVGDVAGEYSETLIENEAGKQLLVRKLDTARPRTPLRVAEVARLETLRAWLLLLPDVTDRRVLWEASFHLWRGEDFDWAAIKVRLGYPRSTARLGQRYREALAKLVCRVNRVPERHFRALLACEAGWFSSAARRESLGLAAVKC